MDEDPPISTPARMLGFAGLLPQLLALWLIATGIDRALGALMALAYAVSIVSFLGGICWGFAMQGAAQQPRLAAIAVIPTLAGFAIVVARLIGIRSDLALVAMGSLVMLTLLVDRLFIRNGVAPPGWMGLRIPLTIGLATLTILAGILAPQHVALTYSS